ncbi:MAG TPA: hypothetical protein VF223_22560 [Trebonia sp.]
MGRITAHAALSPGSAENRPRPDRLGKGAAGNTDPRATYPEKAISPFFCPNGQLPASTEYARLRDNHFRDYTLRIDGLVGNPVTLSYQQTTGVLRT